MEGFGGQSSSSLFLAPGYAKAPWLLPSFFIPGSVDAAQALLGALQFADMNGDSLPDLVMPSPCSTTPAPLLVFLNNGSSFSTSPLRGPSVVIRCVLTQADVDRQRVRLHDFNSDRLTDVLVIRGSVRMC